MAVASLALAAVISPLSAAAAAPTTHPSTHPSAGPTDRVRSVVVLGDSVAAGEGARDGYVYRDRPLLPAWTRSTRVPRTGDACGRSSGAYAVRVAEALDAELTNLACSGASFGRGIVLDARYDDARPDLVLVTAGANSVAFERAFAFCVLSARGVSETEAERIVGSASVEDALVTALALAARRALGYTPPAEAPACTAERPGAYLEQTVLGRSGAIGRQARELVATIRARGAAAGRVPEIVVTTYPDPLPERRTTFVRCPDGAGLGPDELAFMHDLFATLNDDLRRALVDVPGVRVVDPDPAFAGHRWCDRDPWVFGPSIFVAEPASRAPFHPTPAGHRAIADAVLAARGVAPGEWPAPV